MSELRLIECTQAQQGKTIQAIFNQVILNSTALYEYQPRSEADMQQWFETKVRGNFLVLGSASPLEASVNLVTHQLQSQCIHHLNRLPDTPCRSLAGILPPCCVIHQCSGRRLHPCRCNNV